MTTLRPSARDPNRTKFNIGRRVVRVNVRGAARYGRAVAVEAFSTLTFK
jgi:hypothetical protein